MKRLTNSQQRLGNRLTVGLTTYPLSPCNFSTSFVTRLLEKAGKSLIPLAICNAFSPSPSPSLGRR